jgi:hypothetical protein
VWYLHPAFAHSLDATISIVKFALWLGLDLRADAPI